MARKGTRLSREDSSLEWESKQDMKMTCTDSNKAVATKVERNEWVWNVTRVTPQDYMRHKGQQWGVPENAFPVSGLPRGLSLIQIVLSWFREDPEMEEEGLNSRHACGTSSGRSLWATGSGPGRGDHALGYRQKNGNQQYRDSHRSHEAGWDQREHTEWKVSQRRKAGEHSRTCEDGKHSQRGRRKTRGEGTLSWRRWKPFLWEGKINSSKCRRKHPKKTQKQSV